jgi:hypothetical protein
MNFTDEQKAIEKLLLLPDKRVSIKGGDKKQYYKGVYIFSRDVDDTSYKIGMAWGVGGIFQRLKNYKICYPYENEFFIQYILISATSEDAKKLEKKILSSQKLKMIEQTTTVVAGKRSREWRIVSKRNILNGVLKSTLEANPNLWTHIVVFGETGWVVHTNASLIGKSNKIKDLVRPSKSRATKNSLFEAEIKTQNFDIDGNEKIGDKIKTQWGDATVMHIHKNGDFELKFQGWAGTYRSVKVQ